MRVLVVLSDLNDSGAARVSLDRARRWQATGDDVTVLAVAHGDPADRVQVPSELGVVTATRTRRALRFTLPVALCRLVRQARRADVVVSGTEVGWGLLLARLASTIARRPFAVTVQSNVSAAVEAYVEQPLKAVTRAALRHVDLAVCVSSGLVPALVDLGLHRDRAAVVHNAVDVETLRTAAAEPPALDWPEPVPVVVGSGRLVRQKGFDLLLRAHALALADGAPAHRVVLLGEGEERAALTRLAADLGIASSVRLAGFTGNPHAVVGRAELCVVPSRWEGFSLTLVEALACGTPCVAFDCVSGPSEVLAGGRYGQLVAAGDVAALARAITDHLRDPSALRARVARTADAGSDFFDPARAAARHRDALAALTGSG